MEKVEKIDFENAKGQREKTKKWPKSLNERNFWGKDKKMIEKTQFRTHFDRKKMFCPF